ncbi:hypothetical protein JCM14076_17480 [Methylosoma difficile]
MKTLQTVEMPDDGFVAGTLVDTKEGLKPIELIRVGDWVLSQPEQGGDKAYKRVTQTFRFEDDAVWAVSYYEKEVWDKAVAAGSMIEYSDISRLIVTPNHPFWVKDKGWVSVQNLTWDDEIELADGNLAVIQRIRPLYNHNDKDKPFEPAYFLDAPDGDVIDLTNGNSGETIVPKKGLPPQLALSAEELRDPKFYFRTTVYNFEVEDFHTYYVGTKGVWVHNTHCSS